MKKNAINFSFHVCFAPLFALQPFCNPSAAPFNDEHPFGRFGNPETVVASLAHHPGYLIAREKQPGILFIFEAEFFVHKEIAQLLPPLHAKGDEPVAGLPPSEASMGTLPYRHPCTGSVPLFE